MAGLLETMNGGHAASLLLLARHFGRLPTATSAVMTTVDGRGFQLRCTYRLETTGTSPGVSPSARASGGGGGSSGGAALRKSSSAVQMLNIPFPKLLQSQEQCVTVLLAMIEEAASALGVPSPSARAAPPADLFLSAGEMPPVFASPPASAAAAATATATATATEAPSASPPSAASGLRAFPPSTDMDLANVKPVLEIPPWYLFVLLPAGMLLVLWLAYFDTGVGGVPPLPWLRTIGYTVFQSKLGVRILWWWAFGMHVGEALWAWWLVGSRVLPARGSGRQGARLVAAAWVVQTFILGYPSLGRLRALPSLLPNHRAPVRAAAPRDKSS